MQQHLHRLRLRPPFLAFILTGANHLLLVLRIRNHGLPRLQVPAHPLIHVLKLLVPVGMIRAFQGFGIGLQAVLQGRDEKKRVGR